MRGNMFSRLRQGHLTPSPSNVVSRMLAEQQAMGLGGEDSDGDGEK